MDRRKWIDNKLFLYLTGFLALFFVHFVADYNHFIQREGFNKYSPYLFLLLLYGWIIFHNLILFDGLYLKGKKRPYFRWTALAMVVSSLNMFFILYYGFNQNNPLIPILNFWIYTLLGLGVYMIYRYLKEFRNKELVHHPSIERKPYEVIHFTFTADKDKHDIPLVDIMYLESLENYVRVYTVRKTYVVRIPLKEAGQQLPVPGFIQISRSCIINTIHIHELGPEFVRVGAKEFKIGKVYKKYVEDQLGTGK